MRMIWQMVLVAALALNLAACGTKGKLKSPSQIRSEEAKKARKAAEQQEKNLPLPPAGEGE